LNARRYASERMTPIHAAKLWRISLAVGVLLPLLLTDLNAGPREAATAVRDLSDLLDRDRAEHGLPAIAALVIEGDRIVAEGAAGTRRRGGSAPVQLDDRWHLGSDTKAITATMIAILIERGVLSWETTIGEALPALSDVMHPKYRDVTIEMLLAHRGGIGHERDVPGLWDVLWKRDGTPPEQRRKLAEVMLAQPPKVEPGDYFYSNCGFSIAGHMVETRVGRAWEQLMRELVFEPLGMHTAGFGVPWQSEPATDPWPHIADGTPLTPGPMADNPPSIGPGGTVHASIRDWAKFVIEHLKGSRGKDGALLSATSYRRLHRGRTVGNGPDQYALGWAVVRRPWAKGNGPDDSGRSLNHAGSNNSWYALAWIVPELGFAVLCTTNIGGPGIFAKIDAINWAVIQDHLNAGE